MEIYFFAEIKAFLPLKASRLMSGPLLNWTT